jgi:hypothetical protein
MVITVTDTQVCRRTCPLTTQGAGEHRAPQVTVVGMEELFVPETVELVDAGADQSGAGRVAEDDLAVLVVDADRMRD